MIAHLTGKIRRGKRTVAICWAEYFRYCDKSCSSKKTLELSKWGEIDRTAQFRFCCEHVHIARNEPNWPAASRPSYATRSLATGDIVVTWLAAAKLMPSAHRPPDKTRRSCRCHVRQRELSRPDKCVRRRSASSGRTAPPDTLRHRSDTERTCLAVGPTQFTPPHQTRQNSPVCVVSGVAVWTGQLDNRH